MKRVLTKQTVNIVDETGIVDDDLQLRVFKNNDDEYEIRAFYFGRYISANWFSAYETDLESAISTMETEVIWHIANPDFIGEADKFDIRSN
jgi:hypothetical protein